MLTPPAALPMPVLAATLSAGWDLEAAELTYLPVGYGSHHWEVVDAARARWFATADDLRVKAHSEEESLEVSYRRLRGSLGAARDLFDQGRTFVLAPLPTNGGEPLARATDRFAVSLYRYIDGQSFDWGTFPTRAHRAAVVDLVADLHAAPPAARRQAWSDDFVIPHRDELEAALDRGRWTADRSGADRSVEDGSSEDRSSDVPGPYGPATASLVSRHAVPIRRLLARYDELAAMSRAQPERAVLTHGEPHPGNTILAGGRWLLIDWDTAMLAPPERDLWDLDPGDGSMFRRYARTTGVSPEPAVLELYRIRWDLADIAVEVSRFRAPHSGSAEDDQSFALLRGVIEQVSAG